LFLQQIHLKAIVLLKSRVLGLRLQLSDIYAGLQFGPRPTLVEANESGVKLSI
jgi:hypothetical protein